MNKLFKLKEWLTLEETARRLTTSFGEDVTIADCLQLAIDRHMTISVFIDDTKYGIMSKKEYLSEDIINDFLAFLSATRPELFQSLDESKKINIRLNEKLTRYGNVFRIVRGVYDLPMIGAERFDIYHLLSFYQGRKPSDSINLEGPLLIDGDDFINVQSPFLDESITYHFGANGQKGLFDKKNNQFITSENYHNSFFPSAGLSNVEYVFRRENIEKFESLQLEKESSLNLDESLIVMGAMIDALKNASIPSKKWTQDGLANEMLERLTGIKKRQLDEYFSRANKIFKSNG